MQEKLLNIIFTPMKATATSVLPLIIIAQFCCTSLWFGGNAVVEDLTNELDLSASAFASITSFVQFGFITGTLVFAVLTIADRFKPSNVFFFSAVVAAIANAGIIFTTDYTAILFYRFCTGFFLAGIYPVGMKIAADYFEKGLSKALGFLVGALVLGTSFPHLLKSLSIDLSWTTVLLCLSLLSVTGGLIILLFVPEGPFRKKMQQPRLNAAFKVFKPKAFRAAAFGYFGHMWELYTFWAFVPFIISFYNKTQQADLPVSFLSFIVVASGSIACSIAGLLSQRFGARRIAIIALATSGVCCLVSPFAFNLPTYLFITFLLFWGLMVVADSPMLSGLIAQNAAIEEKGTALTISTCMGFFITILSIYFIDLLQQFIDPAWLFVFLAPGPLLGLTSLMKPARLTLNRS
jgi:MFS family permease